MEKLAADPAYLLSSSDSKFREIYEITDEDHTVNIKILQTVTKAIIEQNIPLIEEYDFGNDKLNPNLQIELRPSTKIRHYQVKLKL